MEEVFKGHRNAILLTPFSRFDVADFGTSACGCSWRISTDVGNGKGVRVSALRAAFRPSRTLSACALDGGVYRQCAGIS